MDARPLADVRKETLTACPVCGSRAFHTVLESDDFDLGTGRYRVEQCDGCGIRFTNPRPIAEDVHLLYADRSFESLPTGGSPLARVRRARLSRRLQTLARAFPTGRLECADLGTGDGFFAQVAAGLPFCDRMTAVDFFPQAPPPLRAAVAAGTLAYMSQDAFLADPRSYHVLFARFVLEHVADPRAYLATLAGKLEPSGVLVIEVPNWRSVWRRLFGKYYSELSLPMHTFHFDPESVRKLLPGFDCRILEDVHGVVLAKSLSNALGIKVARTGLVSMAALSLEVAVDRLAGAAANMTILATKR